MRRWLANKLEAWSYTLRDWADRVRPPYVRPPGPETLLERITREQVAAMRARFLADLSLCVTEDWGKLTAKPAKPGETLRIRLPNDYRIDK